MAVTDFGGYPHLSAVKPVDRHPVNPAAAERVRKDISRVSDDDLVDLRSKKRKKNRMAHGQV